MVETNRVFVLINPQKFLHVIPCYEIKFFTKNMQTGNTSNPSHASPLFPYKILVITEDICIVHLQNMVSTNILSHTSNTCML